jgi:hypothetical protein
MKPNDRWNRLIAVLEGAGYAGRQLAASLRRPAPTKWLKTKDSWYGVGSAYLTVGTFDRDGYEAEITVRMSDHAQKAGGGLLYRESTGGFDQAGDSEVSIHPGSKVNLRNVVAEVEKKLAEAVAQLEAIPVGGGR